MFKIKILILDSGCNVLKNKNSNKVKYFSYVDNNPYDEVTHGTVVTDIVNTYSNENTIISVKIMDNLHNITSDSLAKYLKRSVKEFNPDIINLSLGSRMEKSELLSKTVKEISDKGTLVIASADNYGAVSFPAAYPEVLSVLSSDQICRINDFKVLNNSNIDILGYGGHLSVNNGQEQENFIGSSFIAPLFTAKLSKEKYLLNRKIKDPAKQARHLLKLQETDLDKYVTYFKDIKNDKLEKSDKVVIGPTNKEIFTLLNNADMVLPKIVKIFDYPFNRRIGREFSELSYSPFSLNGKIISVKEIDWESDEWNALVLGHIKKISLTLHKNLLEEFYLYCKRYNKKFFSLDLVGHTLTGNEKKQSQLVVPSTPSLAIIGTSPRQGKVTLQLDLVREMRKKNYKITPFMTEPYAEVLGEKFFLHNGYDAPKMDWETETKLANEIMHGIDKTNSDLSIISTQSQIVPSNLHNIDFIPKRTQNFLEGINPDAFILVTNSFDSPKYILRCIKFIESYFNRPALFTYTVLNKKEQNIEIHPNVLNYSQYQIDKMAEIIIKHFSN